MPDCIVTNHSQCSLTEYSIISDDNSLPNGLELNKYCIDNDDNTIYKGTTSAASGACEIAYGNSNRDEGILVFDITKSNVTTIVNPSNTTISSDSPTYVLFDCSYEDCLPTYGYIHFADDNKLFLCNSFGSTEVESVTDCNSSTLGQVKYDDANDFQICILDSGTVDGDGNISYTYSFKPVGNYGHYLIDANAGDATGTSKVTFAGEEYSSKRIIKTQTNVVAFSMKSNLKI
ncbi:MAG: hypothetical protein E7Z84_05725 [Methanosphaera stadtmanae]|nr:hypothetical protein [Methanosphaera stadtmanae]